MIKKLFLNPVFLSLFVLLLFIGGYIYLNRPQVVDTVMLIDSSLSPDSICFNQSCLQKKEDTWWYQGDFPANHQKVEDLISMLKKAHLDNVISNNPDNFNQLGFSPDQPLVFKAGDTVFELSTSPQNVSHSLIKFINGQQIFKTSYIALASDLVDQTFWQTDYITNMPSYQIQKVSASGQGKTVEINKQDDNWPDQSFLDILSYLPPTSYLGQTQPESKLTYHFSVSLEDDTSQNLIVGQSRNYDFWATTNEKFYYQIDKNSFTKLTSILF